MPISTALRAAWKLGCYSAPSCGCGPVLRCPRQSQGGGGWRRRRGQKRSCHGSSRRSRWSAPSRCSCVAEARRGSSPDPTTVMRISFSRLATRVDLSLVPGLVVADDATATRSRDLSEMDVEICRDANGGVAGYCFVADGALHVDVPDIASFSYTLAADAVRAVPYGRLASDVLRETYYHCVLPVMLPALGMDVLHASAIKHRKGVAAFCGSSGTGKSTIAVALGRRGYTLWADDAVAVDNSSPPPTAVPLPFAVRLRPDAVRFFNGAPIRAGSIPKTRDAARPEPLTLVCILLRTPDASEPVTVRRLDAASACQAALAHAYCFSLHDRALKRRMIESYLGISACVPTCEVRFRPGLEHLPAILDAIEALV